MKRDYERMTQNYLLRTIFVAVNMICVLLIFIWILGIQEHTTLHC